MRCYWKMIHFRVVRVTPIRIDYFPKRSEVFYSLNITQLQCFLKGNTYNIECLKQYKVLALL